MVIEIDSITEIEIEIMTEIREQEMVRMKMTEERGEEAAIMQQMIIMIEVIMIIKKGIEVAEVIILLTVENMKNMSRLIPEEIQVSNNNYCALSLHVT